LTVVDRISGITDGVAIKAPCRAATTANITLSGTQTIDGVAVTANQRVLVKDQTDQTENGIYTVSSGAWSRAKDFDGSRDVVTGTQVFVTAGTTNGNTTFVVTTTDSPIVFDEDNITFSSIQTLQSAAPTGAEYVVGSSSSSLSAERVLTSSATATVNTSTPGQIAIDVPGTTPSDGSVSAAKIASDAVTAIKLADSALGFSMINGTIVCSVNASALTIAIKTLAGTDPSATDVVHILFRNATAATGTYTVISLTAATSLTISSGSTLGTTSSVPFRFWVTGHNDGGTFRLGAYNSVGTADVAKLADHELRTTLAEGGAGAADTAQTIYTGTAITVAAPLRLLGYIEYTSGLGTAGAYSATPDIVQIYHYGMKMPGDVVQVYPVHKTDTTSIASATFADISGMTKTIPIKSSAAVVIGEGHLALSGPNTDFIYVRALRGSTDLTKGDAASSRVRVTAAGFPASTSAMHGLSFSFFDKPGTAGNTTYKFQWASSAGGTVYLNRTGADTDTAAFPRASSSILLFEINP